MRDVILDRLAQLLEEGDEGGVDALARDAIARSVPAGAILDALLAGMAVVGTRFKAHEIFLPDVLLAARAMRAAMVHLKPRLAAQGVPGGPKVVIGTVSGDVHDIGKNLVSIMLQGGGFEVVDLGTDVPAERFVDTAVLMGARVIALSALLTTTMAHMRSVVELLERRGLRGRVFTIVGGAPVTEAFAREIGADAYAFDAGSAAAAVRALLAAT
jgi:5-methyltetrahydrofolate--homocysteine methyltransferase